MYRTWGYSPTHCHQKNEAIRVKDHVSSDLSLEPRTEIKRETKRLLTQNRPYLCSCFYEMKYLCWGIL